MPCTLNYLGDCYAKCIVFDCINLLPTPPFSGGHPGDFSSPRLTAQQLAAFYNNPLPPAFYDSAAAAASAPAAKAAAAAANPATAHGEPND